jgi:hypothetical protein
MKHGGRKGTSKHGGGEMIMQRRRQLGLFAGRLTQGNPTSVDGTHEHCDFISEPQNHCGLILKKLKKTEKSSRETDFWPTFEHVSCGCRYICVLLRKINRFLAYFKKKFIIICTYFIWVFLLLSLAPQPSLGLGLLHKIRLNFLEASHQFSFSQGRVVSLTPNPHPGGPGLCIYIPQRQGSYQF